MVAKDDEAGDDDSEYNVHCVVQAVERDEEYSGSTLHSPTM